MMQHGTSKKGGTEGKRKFDFFCSFEGPGIAKRQKKKLLCLGCMPIQKVCNHLPKIGKL